MAIAGDRADVVAGLLERELDEKRLAAHLLTLGLLHPLSGRPVWHGVEDLPGTHWLKLTADGRTRPVRWWTPPQPDLPLREGAERFRDALTAAVELRTRGRRLLTADLGGLDSTAVYCLAVRGDARVVSYTAATHDALGDDVHWARRTVGALGQSENHHVVPAERIPLTFDGLAELDDHLDAPSLMSVDRNRRMSLLHLAAEQGSPLHLTGLGGDELLAGAAARLHGMVTTHPRTAVPLLRGYTAKYGWSRRRVLRQLLDRRPYRSWLRQVAADLRAPQQHPLEPLLAWSTAPRLPPWATGDAAEAVRELINAEADSAEPLGGGGHGLHRELVTMRLVSQFARHIGQMAAPLGVACAAPYYDDRVVEAALAVDDRERITPYRYKPLIVEAMRGVVPEESRSRATKANATLEEEAGLREHRDQLLALCEQSRLGELGLVDVPTLREWAGRPLAAESESELLHPTVACEVWLRSHESRRTSPSTVT
ncbi:asparagine synthase-related protein [Streptomyces sp. 549]|uniref:asparagine synthase-related protein n=1 Tax=Streptomyces sp. 549 TaxID=3049076 RepID=UPI0024C455A6|nr:asparagine synthase-related protein [Streptomyces sp. 549]MDK1476517.1 asparagine synthase-related protein [Streptomyces sp. 549]